MANFYTTETYIKKCKEKLGSKADKLDFSKVEYKGSNERVTVICKDHGEFTPLGKSMSSGRGCPKCKGRITHEQYMNKVKNIYGDNYDLSKIEYKGNKELITIICPIHGEFQKQARYFVEGRGCSKCRGITGFNNMNYKSLIISEANKVNGILYSIMMTHIESGENFYKIGITSKNVEYRFESIKKDFKVEVLELKFDNLLEVKRLEQKILKENLEYKYIPKIRFAGYTECFTIPLKLHCL